LASVKALISSIIACSWIEREKRQSENTALAADPI
jgi:hypothetical protein